MLIDVGEGLRGIHTVTEVLRADIGYQRDPSAAQFKDNFQKCLEEQKVKGAEVLHKVRDSYNNLYNKFGIQPNTIMLSADYVSAVIAECFNEYQVMGMKPDKLLGMDVMVVTGRDTVKACIVDTEGES